MKGIIGFYQFVRDQQKKQLYLGLILTLLASALEGCSIMTLLPLLRLSQIDPKHAHSMLLGLSLDLTTVLLLFLSILVISSVIRYCSSMFNIRLNIKFANDFRNALFTNITAAKWDFLKSLKSGHLNNMLTMAIQNMSYSCSQLLKLLSNIILSLVYIAISFYFNFKLTLISIGIAAVLFAFLRLWDKYFLQIGKQEYQSFSQLAHKVNEFISSIKITKIYRNENQQRKIISTLSQQVNAPQLSFTRMNALNQNAYLIGGGIAFALIFYLSLMWLHVTFTTLVVLLFIYSRLITKLSAIHLQYRSILKFIPSFADIQDFQRQCKTNISHPTASKLAPMSFNSSIHFKNISFRYPGSDSLTLNNICLKIPYGCLTCIAGPSGIGKSTIVDILCGLLEPNSGEIIIDQTPLNADNIASWQQHIGYVPQDNSFFHDSIRANLFCQHTNTQDDELISALKLAQAWQLVKQLPQQLETIIGPNGIRLSGGERQRLALARALLTKPSLLILDEATNALDHDNERQFINAIQALKPNITILMISHQPHLAQIADHHIELKASQESGHQLPRQHPEMSTSL